jgi:hypothetical protein
MLFFNLNKGLPIPILPATNRAAVFVATGYKGESAFDPTILFSKNLNRAFSCHSAKAGTHY